MLNPEQDKYFDYTSVQLSDRDFDAYKNLVYEVAGISLKDKKKPLLTGRLSKRLRHYKIQSYSDYLELVQNDEHELQMMIDLVSTNETSFFREEKHFDFLENYVKNLDPRRGPFRIWSAACSSGMEAYTTAMVMDNAELKFGWEIFGTDISTRILEKARKALYPLDVSNRIPQHYLKKYCLKGVRDMSGFLLVDKKLRARTTFSYMNLNEQPWPDVGLFDVIFLRNVMIYFDKPTKQKLISNIITRLKSDGYLFVGHSENLLGIPTTLKTVQPSIYRKI
ncbi:MAG: protein-glutamate O-methyltransferase CheR [Gammaproteobacteria bacterium]|nr:protein-glutamate O-methyltransferase CheR [Gammaproteobacteria bacterium]